MAAPDMMSLPTPDTALIRAAELVNSIHLPEATAGSVAVALGAIPVLLLLMWLARRLAARPPADTSLSLRVDELGQRLQTAELLLADSTSEASQLRQRVDELTSRQEAISAGNLRNGLRQAIALSRHGANTRQLVDTCGLSQGEAHLIRTLYGRPTGDGPSGELH